MHNADAGVDGAVIADDHPVGNEDCLRGMNREPATDNSASFDLRASYGGGHKPQKSATETHYTPQQRKSDGGRPMRQPVTRARPEIAVAQRGEFPAFDRRIG